MGGRTHRIEPTTRRSGAPEGAPIRPTIRKAALLGAAFERLLTDRVPIPTAGHFPCRTGIMPVRGAFVKLADLMCVKILTS